MSSASDYTRRGFLGQSACQAAGLAAGSMGLELAAASSAAEPLRVGLIGLGQQGQELAGLFASRRDVRVTALCDLDIRHAALVQHTLSDLTGNGPPIIPDAESLLDRDDVDAVVIATPGHWSAPLALTACQAGKDVYLEQPVGLSLRQGIELEQIARTTGCIMQTGLPQRSGAHFQAAMAAVQSGKIGTVQLARAWSVHRRRSIGRSAVSAAPQGIDYRNWLGPAPQRAFQANRFHQHWPWFWDYGAGELGLWGVQLLDVCRWGLELDLPRRVMATGHVTHFRDDRETPETLTVQFECDDLTVLWEHRQWSSRGVEGRPTGCAFYGTEGTLIVDRGGWKIYDGKHSLQGDAADIRHAHVADFVAAVRGQRVPAASIEIGQRSMAWAHLGNLAWRTGNVLKCESPGDRLAVYQELESKLLQDRTTEVT
ncbi:MAG: Gfo/Idh/MocA family oxidoreductase [Planctomycetaceae bacterium]|nr:Gfo/Idh/MocA family oxidoreductase [Planctomycetaceae bacterium]